MPHVDILFSQLQKQTMNSVLVRGIMQQFKNLICTRLVNRAESRGIGHAHFRLRFFFATSQNDENLLFRTSPRQSHQFA